MKPELYIDNMPHYQLYLGDSVDLSFLPDNTVDLVFADPPFNTGKNYGNGFDDTKHVNDYRTWLIDRLSESARVLKQGGSMWVMNTTAHIGFVQQMLDSLDLHFQNMIVWAYGNPVPASYKLRPTWRPILYYRKGKAPYKWHKKADRLKQETLYFNPARATTPILDDLWVDIPKLVGGYLAQDELVRKDDGRFAHPCQMPEGIIERILKLATDEGDLVLDPFLGSGTTVSVAYRMNRRSIGIEQNQAYLDMCLGRIIKIDDKRQEDNLAPIRP